MRPTAAARRGAAAVRAAATAAATAAVTGAVAAATLLAPPASAENLRVTDARDATASVHDVTAVAVRHGAERTAVVVTFDDLRPDGIADLSIYVDTDAGRRGPELRLGARLAEQTEHAVVAMTGWRVDEEVECASALRVDHERDRATYRVDDACLGDVDRLRVAVKVKDLFDGSHPVTDWAPDRRSFTGWVRRG